MKTGEREGEREGERGGEREEERGKREGEREERERERERERGRERELTQISSDHRLKKMCTTFYSQALDATETTTTIETMGDIEFRRKQKARDLCAKWAQNRRFAQKGERRRMETKGALITKLGN